MSPHELVPLLIFAIPILGILFAAYSKWLKFRAKQQELGGSTQEVEERIQALQDRLERVVQERDALVKRVQTLETIVTSEAWDNLQDPTTDPDSLPDPSDPVELDRSSEHENPDTEKRAEKLAQRLRT